MSVNLKDALNNPGQLFQWALDNIFAALGGDALGSTLIGGTILLSLYLAGNRSFATPAVVLILFGGVLIPLLPGELAGVAGTVMLLGLAAGILAVAERYFIRAAP